MDQLSNARNPAHGGWQAQPLGAGSEDAGREARPFRSLGTPEFADKRLHYYLDGIDIPWQPWAKALFDQRTADNQIDNPESRCLPRGTPKADAFDLHKIVQTPELIVILYEYQTTFRQIFLDGRELPKDPNPTWAGYSTGHWEGDTLVVESNGFNGKAWLSGRGNPTSDAMRLTERMRRRDFGHMDIQLTIDDPKAYTKPWTAELHPELIPDTDLLEFVCNENERDVRHLTAK